MSKASERAKAAFVTEYRALCENHGLMVIQVDAEGYSPFAVAELNRALLEGMVQEMLLERTWNIVSSDDAA